MTTVFSVCIAVNGKTYKVIDRILYDENGWDVGRVPIGGDNSTINKAGCIMQPVLLYSIKSQSLVYMFQATCLLGKDMP